MAITFSAVCHFLTILSPSCKKIVIIDRILNSKLRLLKRESTNQILGRGCNPKITRIITMYSVNRLLSFISDALTHICLYNYCLLFDVIPHNSYALVPSFCHCPNTNCTNAFGISSQPCAHYMFNVMSLFAKC